MPHVSNEWHLRDAEAVASVLNTDIYRGLTDAEVRRRRRREGRNSVWHVKRESATEYALRSVGDLTSAVLVIAALTAAVFERSAIAGTVCTVMLLGLIMRVLAYVKARRTLEEMADEGIPSATVIRDGNSFVVRADELVVGDIVLLCAGDIVPCDGRIVLGDEVRVSERGITENRSGVVKGATVILTDNAGSEMPCEYRVNMLFAGSVVLAGECRMIAVSCGDDTLVSAKHGGLTVPSGDEIPVIKELDSVGRRWNLAMLLFVFITVLAEVAVSIVRHGELGFSDAFIDSMALAASSVGTYLVPAGYISLSLSLRRAAVGKKARAIVKDPSQVARVADVRRIIVSDVSELKSGRVTYTSYCKGSELHDVSRGDKDAAVLLGKCAQTRRCAGDVALSHAGAADESSEFFARVADSAKRELGIDADRCASSLGATIDVSVTRADGGAIYNAIVLSGGVYYFRVSGELQRVLDISDRYQSKNGEVRLTDSARAEILRAADPALRRGAVVIATAHRESPYTTLKRTSTLQSSLCFDGFITVDEEPCDVDFGHPDSEPRPSLILLSCHPERDRCYLEHAGLLPRGTQVLDFREVLSGSDLPEKSLIISVPKPGEAERGIDPSLKVRFAVSRRISDSLPGTAVMTGDPSEAGMISDSTVGIAVSRSAHRPIPQTLKRRSAVSVYPSGEASFSPLSGAVSAVYSCNRSLVGISRTVAYLSISTAARAAIVFLSVILSVSFVTSATLLLLGMITDFLSVLAIGFATSSSGDEKKLSGVFGMSGEFRSKLFAVCGFLAGCAIFAIIYLWRYIPGLSMSGEVSAVCAALILWQSAAVTFILSGTAHGNTAYIINASVSVAVAAAMVFSQKITSFFGSTLPAYAALPAIVLPAVITFAAAVAARFRIRRTRDSVH